MLRAAIALALAWALVGPAAAGPPTVTIRARADLVLGSVRRTDDGQVRIRGTLRDRATGAGLGGQTVAATIADGVGSAITTPDGSFDVVMPAVPGPVDVALSFSGSDTIDSASVTTTGVDPTKATIDLTLATSITPAGVLVTVATASEGVPLALPITLRVTPADRDEPHRDLPTTSGRPLLVKRADALGAGTRRLTARFAGDVGHAAATASTVIELTADTAVSIDAPAEVRHDATVRVTGRVTDTDATGVPRVTVTLLGDDKRRLASAETDRDGRYVLRAEASLLGTGRHGLVVSAEPRESWLKASQSTVVFVTVGAPRPAPIAITIAAFAATVLTAAGFLWARRRRDRKVATATAPPRPPDDPRGGLEPARGSLVSTLRRAADHGFAGVVRDSVRGRPLVGAALTLTLDGDARTAETDGDGRFAFEAMPAGEWSVRAAAVGHVSERFAVTIPHRGELRGARVDLVPVRERAFAIYRTAALPHLPRPELWGIWSPRQIVDHVRAKRPPPALAELTATIEEIYFSGRVADEGILPTVEARATAAIAERGAGVAV